MLNKKSSSRSAKNKKIRVLKGKRKTVARKKRLTVALIKAEKNPVISPRPENNWEAWQTFNPGVILLNNNIHFLYRAIGGDGISRFGYAVSEDGFLIDERISRPVYEHRMTRPVFNYYSFASGGSFGGAEDPRIIRVKNHEDVLYMTYTACDNGLGVALTSIKTNDFLSKKWKWKTPKLISKPGEIHKNWVIFPEKINGKYAILHSINPEILIAYRDNLEFPDGEYIESYHNGACRKNCWDTCVRGAGAPPIKTRAGWLLFYHAIDEKDPGKYKIGAMLLDLNDPTKALYRAKEPVLEPSEDYENNGYKGGVVYASGAIVKDGELLVYYGCADNYVCVACAPLEEFLGALMKEAAPKLKIKTLKKK